MKETWRLIQFPLSVCMQKKCRISHTQTVQECGKTQQSLCSSLCLCVIRFTKSLDLEVSEPIHFAKSHCCLNSVEKFHGHQGRKKASLDLLIKSNSLNVWSQILTGNFKKVKRFQTNAQWTFFQVFVSSRNIQSSTRSLEKLTKP